MAYKIIWSAEAENDFRNIVLYLKDNWSVQSSEKFVSHTYEKIAKLAKMPSLARPTSQQTVFIYRLDQKMHCSFLLMGII